MISFGKRNKRCSADLYDIREAKSAARAKLYNKREQQVLFGLNFIILDEQQVLLGCTPGIQIRDISFEENSQLFEKLCAGFGKLGVVQPLI